MYKLIQKLRAVLLFILLLFIGITGRTAFAQTQGQEPLKKSEEVILLEKGGVLLPQGTLVLEPAFQYTHISKNLLSLSGFTLFEAIHIGTIKVEDIDKDIIIGSLTTRYGLLDWLEISVKAPWLYRREKYNWTDHGETQEYYVSDNDLGDIEGAMYVQLVNSNDSWPDIILNIKGKSDTGSDPYDLDTEVVSGQARFSELPSGTGHWGLSGGFTFVKAVDPAVLFATIGYYYNFERNIKNYGDIKPGDSAEYGFGFSYALNERLSSSVSFQHRLTFETEQNGKEILGSDVNVASIYLGGSYSPTQNVSINLNVGAGLTEDSSDLDINLSIPIYFSLL